MDQIRNSLTTNPLTNSIRSIFDSFNNRRRALNLPFPGNVDNITKEVEKDVFLSNIAFTGLRADMTKAYSALPLFQVSHSLSLGSNVPGMPPYNYGALYGSSKRFLQAGVDSDLSVNARLNYRITRSLVSKFSTQIQKDSMAPSMFQAELDYSGKDFWAGIKSMNNSILSGPLTGMVIGSYLQSLTPALAIGLEGIWQRPDVERGPDVLMSYVLRYKTPEWIGSARLLGQGAFQTSYWRRVGEKVEAGADLNLVLSGSPIGGITKQGLAMFGLRYDFRASSYRAQVDTKGRVGCLLEKTITPQVRVTFSGEIDQWKQQAKLGLGVSIDAAEPEVLEAQEKMTEVVPPPY